MTERVKKQLELLNARKYRESRTDAPLDPKEADKRFAPTMMGEAERFCYAVSCEKEAVFHGDDIFGFNRYCKSAISKGNFGNVVIDYPKILNLGLCGILDEIEKSRANADRQANEFYDAIEKCYAACFEICDMYYAASKKNGNARLAQALEQVPRYPARNYYEALVMLRFLSYILRLNRCVHLPLGRFDVYMKPYYDISVSDGITQSELLELTELFFISINFDTDLYIGIQKGDNGQSLVLGGCDREGNEVFSDLSEICLQASEELHLIDPKINIRVNKTTPLSLYERGTKLTKQGLGFPQYTNDDIAIPYLTSLGYELDDARDYAMAACWELIPSGNGADTPNRQQVVFPAVVDISTRLDLVNCKSFDEFLCCVDKRMKSYCDELIEKCPGSFNDYSDATFLSSFISPCIKRGRDLKNGGAKYFNLGFHGAGISTAADSLCAIREGVFERRDFSAEDLVSAIKSDFVGYDEILNKVLSYPKMGNNDDRADEMGAFIMDSAIKYIHGKPTPTGGVYRLGTGSAMGYVTFAKKIGATADGRRAYTPFASSYSPSPIAMLRGPLSNIKSFTKYDMKKICNGGPFTIEIHDTVFRNEEGEKKVAMLIKTFIDRGGHQIQINAINRNVLLDAQKNPDKYPNLIVRVWGWSGYFAELEKPYQDHIISRTEFTV